MVLGGNHKMHRCTNAPTTLLKENKPGPDGKKGEMSVCESCLEVSRKMFPKGHVTEVAISELKTTTKKAAAKKERLRPAPKPKPELQKYDIKLLSTLLPGPQWITRPAHVSRALKLAAKGYIIHKQKVYSIHANAHGERITRKTIFQITETGKEALKKATEAA